MNSFRIFLSITLFCLIQFSAIQAQRSSSMLASSKTQKLSENNRSATETPKLNLALGQHRASFENLDEYVAANLKYPKLAQNQSIEGSVKVLVVISSDGKVTKAKIINSLGHDCDKAALDLVYNMPKWKPASNYGVPAQDKRMLEFDFKLH